MTKNDKATNKRTHKQTKTQKYRNTVTIRLNHSIHF